MTTKQKALIALAVLGMTIFAIALNYGYSRQQHNPSQTGETTMFQHSQKNPETDAEATALLLGDNPTTGNYAMVGIYEIYRKRDGMSVIDAYLATLNHVIELYESKP